MFRTFCYTFVGFVVLGLLSGCASTGNENSTTGQARSTEISPDEVALTCDLDPIEMRVYQQWQPANPVKLDLPENEVIEFILLYSDAQPVYRRVYAQLEANTVTMCTSQSRINRPTDECMTFSGTDEEFTEGKHAFIDLHQIMRGSMRCKYPE